MIGRRGPRSALRDFIASEAAGGILLVAAAVLAMIVANGPLADEYHHLLHLQTGPVLSAKLGPMTPHLWINDAFMAVFFLLVGLEIKRELVDGRLSSWERRRLPFIAAAAGMIAPALIYISIAGVSPPLADGWAIPAATDIAFALGVLALLGKRAPTSLKLFLTTVAIVDDMGAVAIIALVYTADLNSLALLAAAAILGLMYALGKYGVRSLPIYLALFVLLWFAVLVSGVHATVAGVLAALTIPIRPSPAAPDDATSPLHRLEHGLHPWVAFVIVPLFGFANAGVTLDAAAVGLMLSPLPLGIAAGLFLGKQIGVFGSVWLAVKLRLAAPIAASWTQVYGMSLLCGIGFTMSLFIGALAFPNDALLVEEAKIGVLLGSLLSAIAGYLVLRFAPRPRIDGLSREREEAA